MALEYPYPAHTDPGTTIEVAEGVRSLTIPMGGALNHNNLYLLEDTDGWLVVDTGLATPLNRLKRTLTAYRRHRFLSVDPDLASGGTPARRATATIRHRSPSRVGAYCRRQPYGRAHAGRNDVPDEAPIMCSAAITHRS